MHNNFNTVLLGFKDEYVRVLNHYYGNLYGRQVLVVEIGRERYEQKCPECSQPTDKVKDYYTRTFKHIEIGGYNSIIKYRQRRYKCSCGKCFNETNSFVGKNKKVSYFLRLKILEELKYKTSFKDTANRLNISSPTVIRHFLNHFKFDRKNLSEVICIDEFRGTTENSKYSFIITNPDSGEIIDLLPSRKKQYLIDYFARIPYEERLEVKIVVMDLWIHYKDVVQMVFPNAIIIADTFHYVRHVYWAFNKVRTRIMSNCTGVDYYLLKKFWRNLIKRNGDLSTKPFYSRKFKRYISNQEIVDRCISISETLNHAYQLKEELFNIVSISTSETVRNDINNWISKTIKYNIPEFNEAVKPFINWKEEIINSFKLNPKTKKKYSNGQIEGTNNYIKAIKRIAFGFKNFDIYKARILYSHLSTKNILAC